MADRIADHAERSVRLLPAQHARAPWRRLLRALLGLRGNWAGDDVLYAVHTTSHGVLVFRADELDGYFGSELADDIRASVTSSAQIDADHLLHVTSELVALTGSAELDAAIAAHDVLPVTHDELDVQIIAEVTAALATAPWSLQEVEGVFWELALLRALEVAAGVQLDAIGDLLNLTRDGQEDDDYRAALRLARRVNRSRGSIPEILEAAEEQPEIVSALLQNEMVAYYQLYLHGSALDARRRRLLRAMRAAGIGSDLISAGGVDPFVFGSDGGWNRILAVAVDTYTVEGDVSAFYDVGDAVQVWDVEAEAYIHTTTIVSVTFVGPDTDIVVAAGGGVTPGVLVLEDVERGLQDPDGGPYGDAFPIVGFVGPATFKFAGDGSGEFAGGGPGVGHLIEVVGSSGDDGFYRVLTVSFAAGETSLEVTPTPPAGAGDGQLQHAAPEWAPALEAARSTHGEYADVFTD